MKQLVALGRGVRVGVADIGRASRYFIRLVFEGVIYAWLGGLKVGTEALLQLATKPDDVANIFKVNRSLFDRAKELDPAFYADLMNSFTTTKKSLTKE